MNIRVDLETSIQDGTEVVFRSPVDCSQITGLIVYYKESGKTASKEFALADAHGNNVGDIDHLFAENVVVKVILDVTTSMAFVQNADTNAYLEGRFASLPIEIMDKLCPSFTESGSVVQCEPVEGYPLEVVTQLPASEAGYSAITLTQRGKNLFNKDATKLFEKRYINHTSGYIHNTENYTCTDFIPCSHLQGQTITLNHPPIEAGGKNTGMSFYTKTFEGDDCPTDIWLGNGGAANGYTAVVPDNAMYIRFTFPKAYVNGEGIQIELGDTVTDFEPYREKTYTAEPADPCHGGSFDWTTGQLTVTHKKVDLASLDWFFESGYFGADILNTDTGVLDATAGAALCNCLTHASGRHDDLTTGGYGFDEPDCVFDIAYGEIAVIYRNADNVEEFRAYLQSSEAVLVYPLAEPEILEYGGQTVPAIAGVNTLYSSAGDTRVSGRTDPVTVIEKLTNAILSLGGNI